MNLRVFFIYICKTAHFGWLRRTDGMASFAHGFTFSAHEPRCPGYPTTVKMRISGSAWK